MNSKGLKLSHLFLKELKTYNSTNYRTLLRADLSENSAVVHKAFSSVVTRFFIFNEKHPELSKSETNMLFYKLKIDLVARYFSEFPDSKLGDLGPFQEELKRFEMINNNETPDKEEPQDDSKINAAEISNIELETVRADAV